jgi:hypothetical protein
MTATTPTLLDAALELAADGWFVFPLHSPLHDHPAGYTCTCEEYRHTDRCRERDASRKAKGRPPQYLPPDQHCDKPGKHPWGVASWSKESTRDPARIRAWWSRYPDANIGGDCGKSNRLALDADLYKERYAGGPPLGG